MARRAAPFGHDLLGKRLRAPVLAEDPIHASIVAYLRATLPDDFKVNHTPNGSRLKAERIKQVRLGIIPGWPDISIFGYRFIPEQEKFVGHLEVKTEIGRTSPDQDDVHADLEHLGFPVRVVRSIDQARDAVRAWRLPSIDIRTRGSNE